MKKGMSVSDRVDVLLEVGTEHPKGWMPVHGYNEPGAETDEFFDWEKEWKRLRVHHLDETLVLFDIIEELRRRILSLKKP